MIVKKIVTIQLLLQDVSTTHEGTKAPLRLPPHAGGEAKTRRKCLSFPLCLGVLRVLSGFCLAMKGYVYSYRKSLNTLTLIPFDE